MIALFKGTEYIQFFKKAHFIFIQILSSKNRLFNPGALTVQSETGLMLAVINKWLTELTPIIGLATFMFIQARVT